jgi:FkbM family methyltransferase
MNMKQMLRGMAPRVYNAFSEARLAVRDRFATSSEIVRLPSGLEVEIHGFADRCIYDEIFVGGEYDQAIDLVIRSGEESPLILDLGANVGYFGLRFADRWLQARAVPFTIVGFEGSPETHTELQRRAGQPLLAGHCHYHLGLVGQRSGQAYMSSDRYHFKRAIVESQSASAIGIPFRDIEELLPPGQRIGLLKADIEGAEESFISEYPELLRRTDIAIFEFHHDRCNVDRAFALLADAGLTSVWSRHRESENQSYGLFSNTGRVSTPLGA